MERATVARTITVEGTGLHSGRDVRLHIRPSNAGIAFVKDGVRIPATPDFVVDTRLNTTFGTGEVRVATSEHLMAALYGAGVTDCDVEVWGPEIPAMDGSALPLLDLIEGAGVVSLGARAHPIAVRRTLRVEDGDAWIEAEPGEFMVHYEIDFADAAIGSQRLSFDGSGFRTAIAPARTFGRMQDVERMRAAGLALGGDLHNAVVVDGGRVLNPGGLRFEDEFVRHKVLDLLGDLWSLQAPVAARITACRASHTLHVRLAREILLDLRG